MVLLFSKDTSWNAVMLSDKKKELTKWAYKEKKSTRHWEKGGA